MGKIIHVHNLLKSIFNKRNFDSLPNLNIQLIRLRGVHTSCLVMDYYFKTERLSFVTLYAFGKFCRIFILLMRVKFIYYNINIKKGILLHYIY